MPWTQIVPLLLIGYIANIVRTAALLDVGSGPQYRSTRRSFTVPTLRSLVFLVDPCPRLEWDPVQWIKTDACLPVRADRQLARFRRLQCREQCLSLGWWAGGFNKRSRVPLGSFHGKVLIRSWYGDLADQDQPKQRKPSMCHFHVPLLALSVVLVS